MKKVLVTGASGFIGNYVVEELLSRGYIVIATSSNPSTAALKKWFKKVDYVPFDLRAFDNTVNYYDYFHQPDLLIHLAWEGLPNYTNEFHTKENLPRHKAFLKNLLGNGLRDITVTGTCFEYGMTEGCLTEETACVPDNAYAKAKNELRKWLEIISAEMKCNFKWVRLFYMYGEGQNPNSLISQLEDAIKKNEPVFNMSGGEQIRDFLPVEKVAAYIVMIALQQNITGIINCSSNNPIKVKDFINAYLKNHNKKIKLNLGYYNYSIIEPMNFWGDNTKLLKLINLNNA